MKDFIVGNIMKTFFFTIFVLSVLTIILFTCKPAKGPIGKGSEEIIFTSNTVIYSEPNNITKKFNESHGMWKNVSIKERSIESEEPIINKEGIQSIDTEGNQIIKWSLKNTGSQELINIMKEKVEGIDDTQAGWLIMIRLKYNWREVPEGVKGDDFAGMYSYQLKKEISEITQDIAGVLNAPIGDIRYPPKMDTIIRTNLYDEIEALKNN